MQADAVKDEEAPQEDGDDETVDVEDPVTPVAVRHATAGRAKRQKTHSNDGHAAASDSDSNAGPSDARGPSTDTGPSTAAAAASASSARQPHLRVRIRASVPEAGLAPVAETAPAPEPTATRTARSVPEPVSPQRTTRARALPDAAPLPAAGSKRRRG